VPTTKYKFSESGYLASFELNIHVKHKNMINVYGNNASYYYESMYHIDAFTVYIFDTSKQFDTF